MERSWAALVRNLQRNKPKPRGTCIMLRTFIASKLNRLSRQGRQNDSNTVPKTESKSTSRGQKSTSTSKLISLKNLRMHLVFWSYIVFWARTPPREGTMGPPSEALRHPCMHSKNKECRILGCIRIRKIANTERGSLS